MTEHILELLCNYLIQNEPDGFAWTKIQGHDAWEGLLLDVPNGKAYLVQVREAKIEAVK